MPIFRSIRLYTFYTIAYGIRHCKRELCVRGWFHFMLFVVLYDCWLRLCCMLYWVPVLHNTCYAHWSGWKCGGGAGACSVRLPFNLYLFCLLPTTSLSKHWAPPDYCCILAYKISECYDHP